MISYEVTVYVADIGYFNIVNRTTETTIIIADRVNKVIFKITGDITDICGCVKDSTTTNICIRFNRVSYKVAADVTCITFKIVDSSSSSATACFNVIVDKVAFYFIDKS